MMATELMQVISEKGKVNEKQEPSIPDQDLLRLYRTMVLTRHFDDRMMKLQRQGRIGFYLQSLGEEAAHVGAAFALEPTDWIYPSYREPGAAFLRGFPLSRYVCQLIGNANDPIKGRQMPVHFSYRQGNFTSVSSPVGTQIPQAVGTAWAAKLQKDPIVVLAFFGEGATSQGDFHVGLNFAGVFKTPAILFCRNNGYAISVPIERQTASESIAIKAKAYGIAGVRVDGNDVLAVVKATREAADRGRSGEGATLIEAVTYRRGAHSSSDDPRMYRTDEEVETQRLRDPIQRFKRYLEEKKLWNDQKDAELEEQVKEEILKAVEEAEKFGNPPVESMFEDVFAELTPELKDEQEYLLDYLHRYPRTTEVK
jgi:pyruvate dehydrogenase E1 component subunit alpha